MHVQPTQPLVRPRRWRRALALAFGAVALTVSLAACSTKNAASGTGTANPGSSPGSSPSSSPGLSTGSNPAAPSPEPSPSQVVDVVPDPATIGAFGPATVTVTAGQTVEWVFQDQNPHTVTADGGDFTSAQSGLANGQTYEHTFATPGSYPYHCFIHPQMHGTVVVQ